MADGSGIPLEEASSPRRWLAPVAVVAAVALVVGGVWLFTGRDPGAPAGRPPAASPVPRYELLADGSGAGGAPWIRVFAIGSGGVQRLVEAVRPAAAGVVQAILAGPGGTFFLTAARAAPCESVVYRFRLTGDGHPTGLAPVPGGTVPALVGGLAVSPDGQRLAFSTAPCLRGRQPGAADRPGAATLTTVELTTGARRTWTAPAPSIVGEIVWASDNSTIGYALTPVDQGGATRAVTVRALDTRTPGNDLLAGRVLFRQTDTAATVTSVVMDANGRTGYGMQKRRDPPDTIIFNFAENQAPRVTSTIPGRPNSAAAVLVTTSGGVPRYACLEGIDAFGRVLDGGVTGGGRMHGCLSAYDIPR